MASRASQSRSSSIRTASSSARSPAASPATALTRSSPRPSEPSREPADQSAIALANEKKRNHLAWLVLIPVLLVALFIGTTGSRGPRTNTDRVNAIASEFKCPTCRSESVETSNAQTARIIRADIARRVDGGSDRRRDPRLLHQPIRRATSCCPRSSGLCGSCGSSRSCSCARSGRRRVLAVACVISGDIRRRGPAGVAPARRSSAATRGSDDRDTRLDSDSLATLEEQRRFLAAVARRSRT